MQQEPLIASGSCERVWELTHAEVGAAAPVNPEPATVDAPGAVTDTGRAADLAHQPNVATTPDVTPVSATIVGGAGDDLPRWWWRRRRWWRTITSDDELGSAAPIDPQATAINAPGAVTDAGRTADLANEANVTPTSDVAPVSAAIIGGAGNPRGWTVSRLEGRACGGRCNGGRSKNNGHHQKEFRCACHLASFQMKIDEG
jgi:hypothetical protein